MYTHLCMFTCSVRRYTCACPRDASVTRRPLCRPSLRDSLSFLHHPFLRPPGPGKGFGPLGHPPWISTVMTLAREDEFPRTRIRRKNGCARRKLPLTRNGINFRRSPPPSQCMHAAVSFTNASSGGDVVTWGGMDWNRSIEFQSFEEDQAREIGV